MLPWTLRRIETLKSLSNQQKYDLMVKVDLEVIKNPKFVEGYLMDNQKLASMLTDEKLSNVNHAAAAALYAGEIDAFNSLVPLSSQF